MEPAAAKRSYISEETVIILLFLFFCASSNSAHLSVSPEVQKDGAYLYLRGG